MNKVLIVDDDYSIRELYKFILTDLGYEVETAVDGLDALGKITIFRPDCMMIDIEMPEMTGIEFTRKLHESPDPRWRNIPFVVLTGGSYLDVPLQYAFQSNASCKAFLPKITNPDTVAKTVQRILRERQ